MIKLLKAADPIGYYQEYFQETDETVSSISNALWAKLISAVVIIVIALVGACVCLVSCCGCAWYAKNYPNLPVSKLKFQLMILSTQQTDFFSRQHMLKRKFFRKQMRKKMEN